MFYKIFGNDPSLPNHRDKFLIDHYWSGEPYSVFLAKINKFLSSFEFAESSREKHYRISGIQYLETILKNTAVIISKSKLSPKTEAEVYNAVRLTIEFVFSSSRSPKSNLSRQPKSISQTS